MPEARAGPSPRPHHSSARDYLASKPRPARPAGFCYLGPVFRYKRWSDRASFLKAGIDTFGGRIAPQHDAEMLGGVRPPTPFGLTEVEIRNRRCGVIHRADRGPRSLPGVEAAIIRISTARISREQDLERLNACDRTSATNMKCARRPCRLRRKAALGGDRSESIAGTTNVGGRSVSETPIASSKQSTLKGGARRAMR